MDAFIAENVLAPLGITRWEFAKSPTGEVMTGGGLRLRTRDLAAIAWMLHSAGKQGDREIVPSALVDAEAGLGQASSSRPHVPTSVYSSSKVHESDCAPAGRSSMRVTRPGPLTSRRNTRLAIWTRVKRFCMGWIE